MTTSRLGVSRAAASRALTWAVLRAAVALLAIAGTAVLANVAQRRSSVWVVHGRNASRLATAALTLANSQEGAVRGYVLTHDDEALVPDVAARTALPRLLDSLVAMTADNPGQQARARTMVAAYRAWDAGYRTPTLRATVRGAVPGPGPGSGPVALDRERRERAAMRQFRTAAGTFLAVEEALFDARVRRARRATTIAFAAVLAEVALLLGLLVPAWRQARHRTGVVFDQGDQLAHQSRELQARADALEDANRALGEALTERTATLATVRHSEARVRAIVETARDAIITCDAHGTIISWNGAAAAIFGYAEAEICGASMLELYAAADSTAVDGDTASARIAARFAHLVATDAFDAPPGPLVRDARHQDGRVFPVELSLSRWVDDGEVFVTVIVRDISARAALEARLVHQATHDTLTGLANRDRFRDRVTAALATHADHPERVVVLFLDLDDFKAVNDTAGHATGDELLRVVAARLLDATRGSDTVARLGGDEFGVLLTGLAEPHGAEIVAARLVAAMQRPVPLGAREAVLGASVGLAHGAVDVDAVALLRQADTAMYAAKAAGKGAYRWFASTMLATLLERQQIRADLDGALARGEFWLAYQPIVDLATGAVRGVEALARWTHPTRGPLGPTTFIPVAEASGQIVALGRWALAAACRAAVTMPGEPYVAVNLSARQLADAGLVGDVALALADAGLAPRRLLLEITESVLMADVSAALERLDELKALGVRLAVDDFGTGYSSLRYLQRLPVDVLKVDKSFVEHLDTDAPAAALARTVIALAEMLGLTTVGEGIERAGQAERLEALGCHLGQGYHFSRPVDATALDALLRGQLPSGMREPLGRAA